MNFDLDLFYASLNGMDGLFGDSTAEYDSHYNALFLQAQNDYLSAKICYDWNSRKACSLFENNTVSDFQFEQYYQSYKDAYIENCNHIQNSSNLWSDGSSRTIGFCLVELPQR